MDIKILEKIKNEIDKFCFDYNREPMFIEFNEETYSYIVKVLSYYKNSVLCIPAGCLKSIFGINIKFNENVDKGNVRLIKFYYKDKNDNGITKEIKEYYDIDILN